MGIGYSILKRLAEEGAHVILTSRKKANLEKAETDLKANKIAYDVVVANFNSKEDRAQVFKTIETKFGKLDGLVCNVAVSPFYGKSLDINESQFSKIFEVNVQNTFFTIKDFFPLLQKSKNASILIISSQAGYTAFDGIGIYSVSKTALLGLTKLLALEFSSYKIRVNGIAPGIIRTNFASAIVDTKEAVGNFMKRPGNPDEIAGLASFLLSTDASFITGETYSVTGGTFGKL